MPLAFAFVVDADGVTPQEIGAEAVADLNSIEPVAISLVPFRELPSDPALLQRYETVDVAVAVLNAASEERYEVGYYLVTAVAAPGAAVVTASASCGEMDGCFSLSAGDVRTENAADGAGAVFFPVREGALTGATVLFRPFTLGASGRLTFSGFDASKSVDAPRRDTPPVFSAALPGKADVRVQRGTDMEPAYVIVRRGEAVTSRFFAADAATVSIPVPPGAGTVEVYLFRDDPLASE